jgi:hypothetical protein
MEDSLQEQTDECQAILEIAEGISVLTSNPSTLAPLEKHFQYSVT